MHEYAVNRKLKTNQLKIACSCPRCWPAGGLQEGREVSCVPSSHQLFPLQSAVLPRPAGDSQPSIQQSASAPQPPRTRTQSTLSLTHQFCTLLDFPDAGSYKNTTSLWSPTVILDRKRPACPVLDYRLWWVSLFCWFPKLFFTRLFLAAVISLYWTNGKKIRLIPTYLYPYELV